MRKFVELPNVCQQCLGFEDLMHRLLGGSRPLILKPVYESNSPVYVVDLVRSVTFEIHRYTFDDFPTEPTGKPPLLTLILPFFSPSKGSDFSNFAQQRTWRFGNPETLATMSVDWESGSYPAVRDFKALPLFALFFPALRLLLDTFVFEVESPFFHHLITHPFDAYFGFSSLDNNVQHLIKNLGCLSYSRG